MMRYSRPIFVLSLALLAGCATLPPTRADFESVVAQMRADPAAEREAIDSCSTAQGPVEVRVAVAEVMDMPPSQAVPLFCERLFTAIADGRLGYTDYLSVRSVDYSARTLAVVRPDLAGTP